MENFEDKVKAVLSMTCTGEVDDHARSNLVDAIESLGDDNFFILDTFREGCPGRVSYRLYIRYNDEKIIRYRIAADCDKVNGGYISSIKPCINKHFRFVDNRKIKLKK